MVIDNFYVVQLTVFRISKERGLGKAELFEEQLWQGLLSNDSADKYSVCNTEELAGDARASKAGRSPLVVKSNCK